MTVQPDPPPGSAPRVPRPATDRVLSVKNIVWGAVVVVLVGAAAVFLLLYFFGTKAAAPQLEAIKVASTIVLGAGGAVALILAARRQRSTELALQEGARIAAENAADRAKDLAQRERAAEDVRLDAVERRITDLYTKAADQLGSEKAAVRLAGLYALERLADNNPSQRRTIVNVVCAYLRMPFYKFELELAEDEAPSDTQLESYSRMKEELEVRYAAQKIVRRGLQKKEDGSPSWCDIQVNLDGAYLENFTLKRCSVVHLNLSNVTFGGQTTLEDCDFGSGLFMLMGASFNGPARFKNVVFTWRKTEIVRVGFFAEVEFDGVRFSGNFQVKGCSFSKNVVFKDCSVVGRMEIAGIYFQSGATINSCTGLELSIEETTFNGNLSIVDSKWTGVRVRTTKCKIGPETHQSLPEGFSLSETSMLGHSELTACTYSEVL